MEPQQREDDATAGLLRRTDGDGAPFSEVTMIERSGGWEFLDTSPCYPIVVAPAGAMLYQVDRVTVLPDGKALRLFYTRDVCDPNEDATPPDTLTPQVVETERAVRVALYRDVSGDRAGTCAGVAVQKNVEVPLSQPVGGRMIVDTSLFPPRPV